MSDIVFIDRIGTADIYFDKDTSNVIVDGVSDKTARVKVHKRMKGQTGISGLFDLWLKESRSENLPRLVYELVPRSGMMSETSFAKYTKMFMGIR